MKNNKFKFSIIVAFMNTEEYLEEAITSVIHQSLEFKDNVQLILVNDGSSDSSGDIAEKYAREFPNNIVSLENEQNMGVSKTRNRGIDIAEGEYLNFMDSDDKLGLKTLENVYEFLEENKDEVDLVSIPLELFDAASGGHYLNYKFENGNRIININDEPSSIQMHVASSFIKNSLIQKENFRFNPKLAYAEDALLCTQVIMKKERYGVVADDALYYYRKRQGEDSAIQSSMKKETWYNNTLDNFHYKVIEEFGEDQELNRYCQNIVFYDLGFRIKHGKTEGLTDQKKAEEYVEKIKDLIGYIDPEVIWDHKYIGYFGKLFALKHRFGDEELNLELDSETNSVFYRDFRIKDINRLVDIKIIKFELHNSQLRILATVRSILPYKDFKLKFKYSEKSEAINLEPIENYNLSLFDDNTFHAYGFDISIDYIQASNIDFILEFQGNSIEVKPIRLLETYRSYYKTSADSNLMVSLNKNLEIFLGRYSFIKHLRFEITYWLKLLYYRKIKIFIFRILSWLFRLFKNKQVLIFSDRGYKAQDSGEEMFRYFQNEKHNYNTYFSISQNSEDFIRLKNIGNVVARESIFSKVLFLNSDLQISSHADQYVLNIFGKNKGYYYDMYNFKFAFLQHGVIQNDLSSWLNKYSKDIDLFVTSTRDEWQSILNYNYYYTQKQVKLTGLPRFDKLVTLNEKHKTKRKIMLAPTWRKNLVSSTDINGQWQPISDFKESDYYKFYNELINDQELIKRLESTDTELKLCLHPSFIVYSDLFTSKSNNITISEDICDYQHEFATSSLMITDYSSVAFDFAYLQKPVIYSQFDFDQVDENHIFKQGYFNYEKDGFGQVTKTHKKLKNAIISKIDSDFKQEQKYKSRIQKTFENIDSNNKQRVFNNIKELLSYE